MAATVGGIADEMRDLKGLTSAASRYEAFLMIF